MLRGLMGLAPQIYDSLESLANVVNEGYVYTQNEITTIQTQYNHLAKKINKLGTFLCDPKKVHELPITRLDDGTYRIHPDRITELHDTCLKFLEIMEVKLRTDIVPYIIKRFFTSKKSIDRILDENNMDKIPAGFRDFDKKMIEAVLWTNKFDKYSKYVVDESAGVESSKTIIVDKLINDTILALSRIYPDRLICPTEFFWILPEHNYSWEVPDSCVSFTYTKWYMDDFQNEKLYIGWSESSRDFMRRYSNLYKFSVSVSMSVCDKKDGNYWNLYYHTERHQLTSVDALEFCVDNWKRPANFPNDKNITIGKMTLIAEIKSTRIKSRDVAILHNIDISDLSYGSLLQKGDYSLIDPIFSIQAIIHNTIGSAQFTIQTTVTLFQVWVALLYMHDSNYERDFRSRYDSISTEINYMQFSSVSNCLVAERYFTNQKSVVNLADYIDRFIEDLEFMRKFIFRSNEGVKAMNAVIKI